MRQKPIYLGDIEGSTGPTVDSVLEEVLEEVADEVAEEDEIMVAWARGDIKALCERLRESVVFSAVVAVVAVLSAVQLAADSSLMDPNSFNARVMLVLNSIFTAFVCIDNIIDIIGEGPAVYFTSPWNWGDFAVTVVSLVGMFIANKAMIGVRVLKVLKTLIALQRIEMFSGLKNTMKALVDVIPNACFVFLFFSCTLILFSIFMVSSLKGKLRSCHGNVFDEVIAVSPDYSSALSAPKEWDAMDTQVKLWFGPHSAVFDYFGKSSEADEVCGTSWPSLPCCVHIWKSSDPPSGEGGSQTGHDTHQARARHLSAQTTHSLSSYIVAPMVGEPLAATSRSYCECWGGSWEPDTIYLFDNIAQGFLTLFQLSTLEGWVNLKHLGRCIVYVILYMSVLYFPIFLVELLRRMLLD